MKKKTALILLTVAVIGAGYLFFQNIYQKHIVFLKTGTELFADETWIVGDTVFYRQNKENAEVRSVATRHVRFLKKGGTVDPTSGWLLIKNLWVSSHKKAAALISEFSLKKNDIQKWIFTAGAIIIGIVCCSVVIFKLKSRIKAPGAAQKKKKRPPEQTVKADKIDYQGHETIVQFFLMVFKHQKGVDEEGEAFFRPVETRTPDGNFIYELRVKIGDDWASRRMTIGPIGEESGSRSTCYYVIYDDHMVVKIPPLPVTNFKKYIQSIKRDGAIAEQLQPKECLIPRISVILKKIHPFYDDTDLSIEKLEEKYIEWLEDNEPFQAYLKIGNTFAYFMDLSKYFFLGNILKKIHGMAAKITEEIFNQPDIIWNPVEFESRYGSQHVAVVDRLQPVYTSFENRTREVLRQNHLGDDISTFQIKEWFLVHLSGGKLSPADIGTKPGVAFDINAAAMRLFQDKEVPVEQYRSMIRTYVLNKNLQQHKGQISGLVTNLIDLLAWLKDKKVAMRDLKPDNLLVAGNPSKFPQFLESASLYSIGLIDVETAVSFGTEEARKIDQPPLGGTPAYSTPSHQLRNDALVQIFGDLPLILHLQDWFATVGMIYAIIAGERLFDQTAKILIKLKSTLKDYTKKKEKPAEVLAQASKTFWKHAVAEMEMKIQENEQRLNSIGVIATKESKQLLLRMITHVRQSLLKTIERLIASQDIFKGEKSKQNLRAASSLQIIHFKLKFMEKPGKNLNPVEREKTFAMLDELAYLKKQSALLRSAYDALAKPAPILSSTDLIKTMFTIVLVVMHQRPWGTVLA